MKKAATRDARRDAAGLPGEAPVWQRDFSANPARAGIPHGTAPVARALDGGPVQARRAPVAAGHAPPAAVPESSAALQGGVVQRMVALSKRVSTENFVELTSINYGVQRAGGPVERINAADFSRLGAEDRLFIVAHGAPGSSGDFTAQQIAGFLTHPRRGLTTSIAEIKFTSCYAGKGERLGDEIDSVVAVLTAALGRAGLGGIPVSGAKGMSIKSDEVGDEYSVVKTDETSEDLAGAMQNVLELIYKPRSTTATALAEEARKKGRALRIEEKAALASQVTGLFYGHFMRALADPAAFAGELEGWMGDGTIPNTGEYRKLAADLKGGRVIEAQPPMTRMQSRVDVDAAPRGGRRGGGGGCFLTSAVLLGMMAPDNCHELQTLRYFRDGFMAYLPGGKAQVARYYRTAPGLNARLAALPDAAARYQGLSADIQHTVALIERGAYPAAYQTYLAHMRALEDEFFDEGLAVEDGTAQV